MPLSSMIRAVASRPKRLAFTPGPWGVSQRIRGAGADKITSPHDACWIAKVQIHKNCIATPATAANAQLIAAAPDLYEAAKLLEGAEEFNANCPDCDGDGVPECCETCFPRFDDARLKRRAAIAKAEDRNV